MTWFHHACRDMLDEEGMYSSLALRKSDFACGLLSHASAAASTRHQCVLGLVAT